ncbi:MAG TPA: poly(A) polymerase [Lachnospiraceae bacterium]|nr:poly(A) polymerase [Lachnospiraceae bacterium]
MDEWTSLLSLIPREPDWQIPWDGWKATDLHIWFEKMAATQQNPLWHGEGDVWSHTQMVCEELSAMETWRCLDKKQRQELFLAALLHDIGKVPCTRIEDGHFVSPNHTAVGARMAREILWQDMGLCGTDEARTFRETVCSLIRYHSVPAHILDQSDPERRLFKIASMGELAADFSIKLLCILEEADMRGRVFPRIAESVDMVRLCAELAEEQGCLNGPGSFPSAYARHAYLSGRKIQPGQDLYDDTWGEIVLLSGLPGTGKDTWVHENFADLPMVSLDVIRKQKGISPLDDQGPVAAFAREQAKEYLRKKQPFVWNATNLTPSIREKQVRLFQDYHASVRIVFLETTWEEQLRRNKNRADEVPEQIIRRMLRNLVLPERFEAQRVEWESV